MARRIATFICIGARNASVGHIADALSVHVARSDLYRSDFRADALDWRARDWRRACMSGELRALLIMRDPVQTMSRAGDMAAAADYGKTLRAMQDGLPYGGWSALFAEDIEDDPAAAMRAVGALLGIAPAALPTGPDLAPALGPPPEPDARIRRRASRIARDIAAAGFSPPDRWICGAP